MEGVVWFQGKLAQYMRITYLMRMKWNAWRRILFMPALTTALHEKNKAMD
jgi:hypothetical protein